MRCTTRLHALSSRYVHPSSAANGLPCSASSPCVSPSRACWPRARYGHLTVRDILRCSWSTRSRAEEGTVSNISFALSFMASCLSGTDHQTTIATSPTRRRIRRRYGRGSSFFQSRFTDPSRPQTRWDFHGRKLPHVLGFSC